MDLKLQSTWYDYKTLKTIMKFNQELFDLWRGSNSLLVVKVMQYCFYNAAHVVALGFFVVSLSFWSEVSELQGKVLKRTYVTSMIVRSA